MENEQDGAVVDNSTLAQKTDAENKAAQVAETIIAAGNEKPLKEGYSPRIKSFTGQFLTRVVRTRNVADPMRKGATIQNRATLQGPTGLVLQAVVGKGEFPNTHEKFITILGQYAPGMTARLTVSAQNIQPVIDKILKKNVDVSSGISGNGQINWPLLKEVTVSAFGTPMQGRGLLVSEMHLLNDDGSAEPIIGATTEEAVKQAEELFT